MRVEIEVMINGKTPPPGVIEMGRLEVRIAQRRNRVGTLIVGEEEEDIRVHPMFLGRVR